MDAVSADLDTVAVAVVGLLVKAALVRVGRVVAYWWWWCVVGSTDGGGGGGGGGGFSCCCFGWIKSGCLVRLYCAVQPSVGGWV